MRRARGLVARAGREWPEARLDVEDAGVLEEGAHDEAREVLQVLKGGDLDGVAFARVHLREKADCFGWASSGRADGGDEMEKMHAGGRAWSMIRAGVLGSFFRKRY